MWRANTALRNAAIAAGLVAWAARCASSAAAEERLAMEMLRDLSALFGPSCSDALPAKVAGRATCLMPGDRFRDHRDAPEMVLVATEQASFAVSRLEVTFADWDACAADGACDGDKPSDHGWARDRKAIIDVEWREVAGYIDWLSGRTGEQYRLVSDREWGLLRRADGGSDFGLGGLGDTAWLWVGDCPPRTGVAPGAPPYDGDCLRRARRGGASGERYRYDVEAPIAYAFAGFRVARAIDAAPPASRGKP